MHIARNVLSTFSSYLLATADMFVERRLSAIAGRVEKPRLLGF
jgi:hypothetical protein